MSMASIMAAADEDYNNQVQTQPIKELPSEPAVSGQTEDPAFKEATEKAYAIIYGYIKAQDLTIIDAGGKGKSSFMHSTELGELLSDFLGVTGEAIYITADKSTYKGGEIQYIRQFFHEIIHSTGTRARLAREHFMQPATDPNSKENRRLYAFEELVAEFGTDVLMKFSGLDSYRAKDQTANYVVGYWAELGMKTETIDAALPLAHKAAEYVLTDATGYLTKRGLIEMPAT